MLVHSSKDQKMKVTGRQNHTENDAYLM